MADEHIMIRVAKTSTHTQIYLEKKSPNIDGQEVAIPVTRTGKLIEFNQSKPEKEPLLERVQKGILLSREESRVVSRTVRHTKISKLIEAFNSLSNSKYGSK
ncbi:hypothetical protein BC833DRAFT_651151 [Globomyces pollinis-pini]|nr:hypothetical protein BC833DRAFT_651151 [Globomyces pollinis-pini]